MDVFMLRLLLTFFLGGLIVVIVTICADKFGSKIGGMIGGLPSTVVVAFFFIALNQGPEAIYEAGGVLPLAQGITGLYMVIYVLNTHRNFATAIAFAMASWFFLTSLIVAFNITNFYVSMIGFILLLILIYNILENKIKVKSFKSIHIKHTFMQTLGKGVFSGSLIAFAVLMSKIGGPMFGGIFAAFPAVFTSTLIITNTTRGIEFTVALAKSLTISGMVNVVIYSTAARYFYPMLGLWYGTVVSIIVSLIGAIFVFEFIKKKIS